MRNSNVSIKSTLFDQATTAFSPNHTTLSPTHVLNLQPYDFLQGLSNLGTLYLE